MVLGEQVGVLGRVFGLVRVVHVGWGRLRKCILEDVHGHVLAWMLVGAWEDADEGVREGAWKDA